jgi:hypothetical protein
MLATPANLLADQNNPCKAQHILRRVNLSRRNQPTTCPKSRIGIINRPPHDQ